MAGTLIDFILKNKHFLEQFANGLDKKLINSLKESQIQILKKLESKPWINEISKSHYKSVLAQSMDILKQTHNEIDAEILNSLSDISKLEYYNIANAIRKQEGLELILKNTPNMGLPAKALKIILKPKLGDFLLSDLFVKKYKTHSKNIKKVLLNGLVQGHSMQVMAKNIKLATKLSMTESTRIARTSIMDVSNKSLQQVYSDYEDYIVGYKWLATLDHKTCLLCGHFDGLIYDSVAEFGITPPAHFLCFIDPKVSIYTSKGWKPISKIQIGDLVLTHRARFRKVTELIITPKQKPNVVKIYIKKSKHRNVTLTEDHPIMINGEWKSAKDIKIGDKINYLSIDNCKRCGKLIPYGNKYCSRRCLSLDIIDKQWNDPKSHKGVKNPKEFNFIELEVGNIKKWGIKKLTKLYNFSVEEDESYISKGFVVHNCRCILIPLTEYDLAGIDRPYKIIKEKYITKTGKVKYKTEYGKTEASERYKDWFDRQNELFQKDVLGIKRYRIYKSGKLNFEKFSDIKTGKILNFDELSKKYNINFNDL